MKTVYLSLGSNMGNRLALLKRAIQILKEQVDEALCVSPFYETDPVGYVEQDCFVNCAVRLVTALGPLELLAICQSIEEALDRVRVIRWGPRTIDCDIIFFGDLKLSTEQLTVPHPRYKERAFVLAPLLDICIEIELKNTLELALKAVENQNIRMLTHE